MANASPPVPHESQSVPQQWVGTCSARLLRSVTGVGAGRAHGGRSISANSRGLKVIALRLAGGSTLLQAWRASRR
eukprot:scaffold23219_cov131-Isochrysis_galbana.AAC.6